MSAVCVEGEEISAGGYLSEMMRINDVRGMEDHVRGKHS